jgi:hypothetical protein
LFLGNCAQQGVAEPVVETGQFPPSGAKDVCTDTPLRLTFNAAPAFSKGMLTVSDASNKSVVASVDLGAGTATQTIGGVGQFNYYPVVVSGNEATIHLPDGSLKYGKTYVVTLNAGAVRSAGEWRFATKAAPPAGGSTKLVVAADGSADFCTVQGAIDAVPEGSATRTTILIRKGVYNEIVRFSNKNEVTFAGEDRKGCVIAYANNAVFNPSSDQGYHRAVFMGADSPGLVIENLTIRNSTPRGGSQAEALIINGNQTSRAIVANVDLYSFQDTLQINAQAYLSDCYIEGDVDFMWGKGPCYFENCHCFGTRSKAYYAQIRNPATNHGFVYHRCVFDGPEGVTGIFLNRIAPSAYPHSEVVLLDCVLGPSVSPVGWLLNAGKGSTTVPTTAPDLHFWEFNSHYASGKPVDVSRRLAASRQLKMPEDAELIGDYSKPSFVLGDGWEAQSDPNLPAGAAGE